MPFSVYSFRGKCSSTPDAKMSIESNLAKKVLQVHVHPRGRNSISQTNMLYASIPPASSDDEMSFERNQKLLMEEFGKPKPRFDAIKQLMTCTFPMRRETILSNNDSILDILSSYPMLKKSNIVSVLLFVFSCIHSSYPFACTLQLAHEYSLVVQDAECREKFLKNFPLWVRAIVSYCKEAKINSVQAILDGDISEDTDESKCICIYHVNY